MKKGSYIFDEYLKLSEKYDKLLNDYANLFTLYKTTRRQLYSNNNDIISQIRHDILSEFLSDNVEPINTFCPYIKDYCLYINTDYCVKSCNQKRR